MLEYIGDFYAAPSFAGVVFWILAAIGLLVIWLRRLESLKSRIATTVIIALAALTPLFWVENNPFILIGFIFAACLVYALLYALCFDCGVAWRRARAVDKTDFAARKRFHRKMRKGAHCFAVAMVLAFVWAFSDF